MAFDKDAFGLGAANSAASLGFNLVGNAASGLINNLFYKRNLNLQVKAQKELMDYQNAYNSPTAQMQRLQEAGLNPNLVYGSQAPAGQSGNASAPSGVANAGAVFNTPDIVGAALRLQDIKNMEADTELKKANAEYLRTQNNFYPEIASTMIAESQTRMSKMASDIDVNKSSIQYQSALKALAEADEALKRGQIDLQSYQKQVMIAQTRLFMSDVALKDTQTSFFKQASDNMKIEGELMQIQLKYNQIVNSPLMAQKEKEARLSQLEYDIKQRAASIGIQGSKAAQWTKFVLGSLCQAAGIATSVGLGVGGFGAGMKAFNSLGGNYQMNGFQ